MEGYESGAVCARCKGRCCREKGCCLSPEDMFREIKCRVTNREACAESSSLKEKILGLLTDQEEGYYAIDHFSTGKEPFFYLRMRHKCYTFIGVDAMGECIALGAKGCILPWERRPKGGRFLESNEEMHCVQRYTKEMMYEDWMPYQEILSSIWREYDQKFKNDGTYERCDSAYFDFIKQRRNQT